MAKVPARQPRGKKVVKGYRKIRASDLPPDKQAKFREAMIADLTKTITSQIKNDVKEVEPRQGRVDPTPRTEGRRSGGHTNDLLYLRNLQLWNLWSKYRNA